MASERKKRRTGTGRYDKGISGNPAGRPPGSRNKATLLMEGLLERESEQLIRKAIKLALGGDTTALRLCMDRILPPCQDRPIHLNLQPIDDVQQVSSAMSTVVEAIGEGRITPSEGETLANILDVQKSVLSTGDLERRVEQLEQAMQARATDKTEKVKLRTWYNGCTRAVRAMTSLNLKSRIQRLERQLRTEDRGTADDQRLRSRLQAARKRENETRLKREEAT